MTVLYKDLLLQQVALYLQVNLQSILGWLVIQLEGVIMQASMKVPAFVFLMTSLLVLNIYKKKDMQERY